MEKKELFEGLFLEKNWDWTHSYPVIHINFGDSAVQDEEHLEELIRDILDENSQRHGVKLRMKLITSRFRELIIKISGAGKKVVVLVDEYDKPVLDRVEDKETAIKIGERLKDFYSVLKDADEHLRFVFITGVSKFSKVSLFSGLNQLNDITLDRDYAEICGYTENELLETFKDELKGSDELEEIRSWYNGYSWCGEKVYNPFDILLYLQKREFRPYWFETGTPTFLIKLMTEKNFNIPAIEKLEVGEEIISSFDVDFVEPENLLFQTGCLTIKESEQTPDGIFYTLTYPNKEVRISLNRMIVDYLVQSRLKRVSLGRKLHRALEYGDVEKIRFLLQSLFSAIPYNYDKVSGYEYYWSAVVYSFFHSSGVMVISEDTTSSGRIDMTAFYGEKLYIFEFKVEKKAGDGIKALEQIKQKKYWEKYKGRYKDIYLVGIEFSEEKHCKF